MREVNDREDRSFLLLVLVLRGHVPASAKLTSVRPGRGLAVLVLAVVCYCTPDVCDRQISLEPVGVLGLSSGTASCHCNQLRIIRGYT